MNTLGASVELLIVTVSAL